MWLPRPTSGRLSGDGVTSFGTVFTLPSGFVTQRVEMAAGSDRLYVSSHNGSQGRLFVLDAGGDTSGIDGDTVNLNSTIALPLNRNLYVTGETVNAPNTTSDVSTLGTGTINVNSTTLSMSSRLEHVRRDGADHIQVRHDPYGSGCYSDRTVLSSDRSREHRAARSTSAGLIR